MPELKEKFPDAPFIPRPGQKAEFTSELSTLRGQVDSLETRTTRLESQLFSPTTKLTGEVVWFSSEGRRTSRLR